MSEDKQVNTQQAEGNSETNPSTQADKNDVPYGRFQEVNQAKNQFKSENEELKEQLDRVESKLDYLLAPNRHNYSSYKEWLIDKQVNLRVYNNGSIE